jgi:hypothetical protein
VAGTALTTAEAKKYIQKFYPENLKCRDYFESSGVDWRILLRNEHRQGVRL